MSGFGVGSQPAFSSSPCLGSSSPRGIDTIQLSDEADVPPARDVRVSYTAKADSFTFGSMVETSASAFQWEYFEYVYKEMTLSGHQFDQRKHSSLLVKASKAGKWHLLEPVFGSILKAGEIPLAFFSEMACQAIIRRDYEKAVNIFNMMADDPFKISFHDWIDFFERNRERLDEAILTELQEELLTHEL